MAEKVAGDLSYTPCFDLLCSFWTLYLVNGGGREGERDGGGRARVLRPSIAWRMGTFDIDICSRGFDRDQLRGLFGEGDLLSFRGSRVLVIIYLPTYLLYTCVRGIY